jgi:ABC-type transporter Mla subunit MlaD
MASNLMLLAGVVLLTFFSLMLVRRNRQRSQANSRRVRAEFESLRQHKALRGSLDDLLLQIEEMARRVNAQLDTKFAKLETVVHHADERIRRLERLVQEAAAARAAMSRTAAESPPQTAAQAPGHPPQVDVLIDDPPTVEPQAAETQPAQAPPAERPTPAPATYNQMKRVYELADHGLTALKIAEKLHLPIGEVELVLNIRRFA